MGWMSFLEEAIGKENLGAMKKVYDRTEEGVNTLGDQASDLYGRGKEATLAAVDEIQEFKAENDRARENGTAWYQQERGVEGPMTQYDAMVAEDRPLQDQSDTMFGLGRLAGKTANADVIFPKKKLSSLSGNITDGVTPTIHPSIAKKLQMDAFLKATNRPLGKAIDGASKKKLNSQLDGMMKQRKADSDNIFYN
jgi:hypothetical protein